MKAKSLLWYTVVITILKEAALIVIVLWGLPQLGINVPLWGLIVLAIALATYSYISYRLCKPTIVRKPTVAPETIIGSEGTVVTPLAPEGYVKIRGELWKALSTESKLEVGSEIVVVGVDRLRLLVTPKSH